MTNNKITIIDGNNHEFDKIILNEYPYPFAVHYQKLLEASSWQEKIVDSLAVYEFALRTITLALINQYLNENIKQVNDESFNQLLLSKLPEATLGSWVELFFRSLQIYQGKQELFFTPELYETVWDTSQEPHSKRKGVRGPFQQLVEFRNAYAHLRLADTEENAQAILKALRAVLANFDFIRQYDLIRITNMIDEEQCHYDIYRGLSTTSETGMLTLWRKGNKLLQQGWFYLMRKRSKSCEVLELHPFIIGWVSGETQKTSSGNNLPPFTGVALYDRLLKTKVTYTKLEDQKEYEQGRPLLDRIHSIIYYEIEELRMGQGGKIVLNWEELKTAAQELSFRNMKGIKEKYSAELYLQREETFQQFNDFLESDETCFVLTGKSGVGKSNFVLSLVDIYSEQDKICYLMYDGARLAVPDLMQDTIGQDMGRRLGLVDEIKKSFFKSLKNQNLLSGNRKLVIVFDAINENADGKKLLEKIDQLVRIGDDYPWLKVLITSRPQAWRTMRRGLHLADENYFRPKGEDDRVVEMSEFSTKLEEFERAELELAYEKYRLVYNLQTPYERLPVSIRETLRDPLVLRLIAEIYQDKSMPETVQVSDIHSQYVYKLVETERLELEDIVFLEQEIVARMLTDDHFDNKLTTEQVTQAKTRDGRPLWEMLRISEMLSSGEAINASYQRLAEAEILVQQGPPGDYEISFKHARFYDYYGGKRLREMVSQKPDNELESTYGEWIIATQEYPFLWEPVQSALLYELKKGNEKLIVELSQTNEIRTRDLIATMLTDFGHEDWQITGRILQELMALGENELTFWQKHIVSWQNVEWSQSIYLAKSIAIIGAGRLDMFDVLFAAATDRSQAVRALAIQYIHNYWRREPIEGFRLLQRIVQQSVNMVGLPRTHILETAIAISFAILVDNPRDRESLSNLRRIWQDLIKRLLNVRPEEIGSSIERVRGSIRTLLLRFVASIFLRLAKQVSEQSTIEVGELSHFFNRDSDRERRQQVARRLIPYLNADDNLLDSVKDDLLLLAKNGERDIVLTWIATFVLYTQSKVTPFLVTDFLGELFDVAMEVDPPGPFSHLVPINVLLLMTADLINSEERHTTLLLNMIEHIWQESDSQWFTDLAKRRSSYLDEYSHRETGRYNAPLSVTARQQINQLIEEEKYGWLVDILQWDLTKSGVGLNNYATALSGIELLINVKNTSVQRAVIDLLRKLRNYHPMLVDDFLLATQSSPFFAREIESGSSPQTFGNLISARGLELFNISLLTDSSSEVTKTLIWILSRLPESNSLSDWITTALEILVNQIYGAQVFVDEELQFALDGGWRKWEHEVRDMLISRGEITTTELVHVPSQFRFSVLNNFFAAYTRWDLRSNDKRLYLETVANNNRQILSIWERLAAVEKNESYSQQLFKQFVQELAELFESKFEMLSFHTDWSVVLLNLSHIFPEFESLKEIPLVFPAHNHIVIEHVDHLQSLLPNQFMGFILGIIAPTEKPEIQDHIDSKIRRTYHYDVIPLDFDLLVELVFVKSRKYILRRAILSNVDLTPLSPFNQKGAASNDMFFGREAELHELARGCTSKSFAIIGGRRIGKSSILKRLHSLILPARSIRSLFLNCGRMDTSKAYSGLGSIFSYKINEGDWNFKPPSPIPKTFGELLDSPPLDTPLVLLLDEVDKLLQADSANNFQITERMRALDNEDKVHFVLAGEKELLQSIQYPNNPLFNSPIDKILGPLEFSAVSELINEPMKRIEVELVNAPEIVKRIYTATSGHPYLVQRLCHRLIEHINQQNTRRIGPDDVNQVVEQQAFAIDFLETYLSRATVLEHICILLKATNKELKNLNDIQKELQGRDIVAKLNQVEAALNRLSTLRGILARTPNGYEFIVSAFPLIVAKISEVQVKDWLALRREIFIHAGDIPPELAPSELRGNIW